eukprot:TRINITY_DN3591_c0_g2_i1.p1 TRINITY_DN3591_c0_g2~~TRINITY_DN3591_c0_g2_i1.p1  ORF type:complete len:817 (+),score=171.11 TRINITY_DN3591_c0_g2_i1:363-2453(+)
MKSLNRRSDELQLRRELVELLRDRSGPDFLRACGNLLECLIAQSLFDEGQLLCGEALELAHRLHHHEEGLVDFLRYCAAIYDGLKDHASELHFRQELADLLLCLRGPEGYGVAEAFIWLAGTQRQCDQHRQSVPSFQTALQGYLARNEPQLVTQCRGYLANVYRFLNDRENELQMRIELLEAPRQCREDCRQALHTIQVAVDVAEQERRSPGKATRLLLQGVHQCTAQLESSDFTFVLDSADAICRRIPDDQEVTVRHAIVKFIEIQRGPCVELIRALEVEATFVENALYRFEAVEKLRNRIVEVATVVGDPQEIASAKIVVLMLHVMNGRPADMTLLHDTEAAVTQAFGRYHAYSVLNLALNALAYRSQAHRASIRQMMQDKFAEASERLKLVLTRDEPAYLAAYWLGIGQTFLLNWAMALEVFDFAVAFARDVIPYQQFLVVAQMRNDCLKCLAEQTKDEEAKRIVYLRYLEECTAFEAELLHGEKGALQLQILRVQEDIMQALAGLKRYEDALQQTLPLLEAYQKLNDERNICRMWSIIARCHENMDHLPEALVHQEVAADIFRTSVKLQNEHPALCLTVISNLAKLYQKLGRHNERAAQYQFIIALQERLTQQGQISRLTPLQVANTHEVLAEALFAAGDVCGACDALSCAQEMFADLAHDPATADADQTVFLQRSETCAKRFEEFLNPKLD